MQDRRAAPVSAIMTTAPITTADLRAAYLRATGLRFAGISFERALAIPLVRLGLEANVRGHRVNAAERGERVPVQGSLLEVARC